MERIEAPPLLGGTSAPNARAWYGVSIAEFLETPREHVIGMLVTASEFAVLPTQRDAWMVQLAVLAASLPGMLGSVFLENRNYLRNAYRVLLTRARQGMVIFVPQGDASDPTRSPAFYDSTFDYLKKVGVPTLD